MQLLEAPFRSHLEERVEAGLEGNFQFLRKNLEEPIERACRSLRASDLEESAIDLEGRFLKLLEDGVEPCLEAFLQPI